MNLLGPESLEFWSLAGGIAGLVVGDTDVWGRNAGLSLSIETVSLRPFFIYNIVRTSDGPSNGGCSGSLLESTCGVVARSFGM